MSIKSDSPSIIYRTEEELTTPFDGAVTIINHYWCYAAGNGYVFYKRFPSSRYVYIQANLDSRVTEMLVARLYPWATVVRVPIVYIKTDENGYYL